MSNSEIVGSTDEVIMEATYNALCKHGYPAISISKIGDEFDKSNSLLYYHYEDKEGLLEDLLRYLLDQLKGELANIDQDDPRDHLIAVIDRLLPTEMDDDQFRFRRALLEIRSQVPYFDTYHEQFQQSDEFVLSEFTTAIEDGIEQGQFRESDPEKAAEFMYSTAYGAIERGITLEDTGLLKRNRRALEDYIESNLLVDN